ncbi:TPA: hypothetical protein DDZ86_03035 [Candidatus Dependentiae bacterium]|nr:MAG: Plastidic atp adp transporter [candidate division TM6 bacterium GW2011_GWF2_43_87]HBL98594.1 hypothetical protein [Candidatus Dependentiae bacterium]
MDTSLSYYWETFTWLLQMGAIAALPVAIILYFTGHLQRILTAIYGTFTRDERNKFISYGVLFFFIIGIYWLLRCIKDPTFNAFIGSQYTWMAKIVSLAVIFPLVAGYSYLVDLFPRHRLFYAMSAIYGALFLGLWFLVQSPTFGIPAPEGQRWAMLGWVAYVVIESFGSLMVVLFYSFMADTTTPEAGKKGFFITATFAQIGAIFGSTVVAKASHVLGTEALYMVAGLVIAICIPAMVRFIMWFIPKDELSGYQAKGLASEKKKTGFVEGIKLMVMQPYLMGIFVVVSAFEVVATVFDLQFKVFIAEFAKGNADVYAAYTGEFGVYVNVLALLSLLLGIGNLGRRIGLTLSLALMPVLMIINIVVMEVAPSLAVVFWVMVFSKGINYALGQPSKEQLYIPTSRDAKYKSKAWVDTFGSRFSKATGSGIMGLRYGAGASMVMVTAVTFSVCIFWFLVALFLGKKHKHAVERNEVVC